jgi:DNA-binding GntR family transcriptional regulator
MMLRAARTEEVTRSVRGLSTTSIERDFGECARVTDDNVADLYPWRGVYNAIRASILEGTYAPGERLVEQQLANRFGTSRGPIRTALQELERTGLIVSVDRRGTFVRQLSPADVEEIISLWMVLWPFALERAMARLGADARASLEEFKAQVPRDPDGETLLAQGVDFVRVILRIADHQRLLEIFESLIIQAQARAFFVDSDESETWKPRAGDLLAICDALLDGNLEAAVGGSNPWVGAYQGWLAEHPLTPPELGR